MKEATIILLAFFIAYYYHRRSSLQAEAVGSAMPALKRLSCNSIFSSTKKLRRKLGFLNNVVIGIF